LSARGTLFLVAGPSGAGKDALIDAAREALEPLGTHVFPRRIITRPHSAGGENQIAVDAAKFEEMERAGQFALSWRAHGLAYGIPASIAGELERGRHVVINVSRSVVAAARARFTPVHAIEVTAPAAVLAARMSSRGRESEADSAERLARQASFDADSVVVNDGPLYAAVAQFLAVLRG
jgi:ribose 1,5-bisphosphokinase